mgnify:FL=1|jgi:hypothetical protein|tara:strand:+ start:137 stop:400 length:264 start_codon:yes stop_codon:yes gene_type:complete
MGSVEDHYTLLEMWREEKTKRREAEAKLNKSEDRGEGDLTLQIEKLTKENEELKKALARSENDREYDKMIYKRELEDLFKGKYDKGK